MISSVYNYYLSTYRHKESTKYDTHKKSELKEIYHSMLSVNRRSPLYKLENEAEAQKYAIDIKESARSFRNVAAALTNEDGSMAAFSRKKAGSSDEGIVSAEYVGTAEEAENTEGFRIRVNNTAKAQVNIGMYLDPVEKTVREGSYSFDLSIGKYTYEFSFDVDERKSASTVQRQVADLINRADVGVFARLKTNDGGQTALEIRSESTGVPDSDKSGKTFDIQNNERSEAGNIVEKLGMNQVEVMPQNARFEINGEEHTSSSNDFLVMKKFRLHINSASEKEVQIELKPDFDSMLENVSELTSAYNSMVDMAAEHVDEREDSDRLFNEIRRVTNAYREDLEAYGFTIEEDGHLNIEEDVLRELAETGRLSDGLDKLNALKKAMVRKSDDMSLNPMNYVNKRMIIYPNPVRNFTNPYVSSIYSGMMYEGYV